MNGFCRDCLSDVVDMATRCKKCGGHRILAHPELATLSIAHMDCDAFYASIEKRDDPSLLDKPVIVGGGKRGVVSTCCYVARQYGVRSAMPMFHALKLCPTHVVIRPDFVKYTAASRAIREMMRELTPLVESLSLDEAFLDLAGTERIHGMTPAKTMAALARRVENEIKITISIGLSFNKFLAKLSSELDKPRGFAVIGKAEAKNFLHDKPVSFIRGAGRALQSRLAKDGITLIGQLQDADPKELGRRYGSTGLWLSRLANADDTREVRSHGDMKTISSETTFFDDLSTFRDLETVLWRQAERVSARAKSHELAGRTVVLKLKNTSFKLKTRSASLEAPTQLADRIFRVAREALKREADGTAYRFLGVGISNLAPAHQADPLDLIDRGAGKRAAAERAVDKLRGKFGDGALGKGRGLKLGRPVKK